MADPKGVLRGRYGLMVIGLVLLGLALLWWFAYYGQWGGWFSLLDVKWGCISGEPFECANFREFIGPSAIPAYSPVLWWAGIIVTLVGLYVSRRSRA